VSVWHDIANALGLIVVAMAAWDVARRWLASTSTERAEQLAKETAEKDALRAEAKRVIERMVDTEGRVGGLEKEIPLELGRRFDEVVKRVAALEVVASAPVDLTKHDAAVKNLGVQLKELSDHVEEQFKRERASRAGMLAGPQSRRIVG
jgi:hypothetical protein